MTYVPNRIIKTDIETDEKIIDKAALQRNLDLIAKETNNLQDGINEIKKNADINRSLVQGQTQFVNAFLFGGS
jgi:hypothetical protein